MGDPIKGAVFLNRVGSKTILINRSSTDGGGILSQANGVGGGQPVECLTNPLAAVSLQQEVPVVGHDAESKKLEGKLLERFFDAKFKPEVVCDRAKDGDLTGGSVADVQGVVTGDGACSSGHIG